MTTTKPIIQVRDQDFYSPWGRYHAETYHLVSATNPVHMAPELPPPAQQAQSSVQAPVILPDTSMALATPNTYFDQFRRGAELYETRQFALAVECFHAADRVKPGEANCIVMLGNCYQSMGQDSKAEAIYKYALDIDPHHAIAWYNRGLILQRLGQLQDARECHLNAYRDRFLRGSPNHEGVVSSLAAVLSKLGQYESACRVLTEGLRSHKGQGPLLAQLLEVYSDMGDPGSAIDLLRLQEPPDLEEWYAQAPTALTLNDRFRQTELLSRLMSMNSFSLPKHPKLQAGFRRAMEAAIAAIKAEDCEEFSMLEVGGLGMYSIMAAHLGCARTACRVKSWGLTNRAIRGAFRANGLNEHHSQIQEYVPTPTGAEAPLAELPPQCRLVVQAVNCMATVPLLLSRLAQFQQAGLRTVPQSGKLVVIGIQCDQLHNQTNVGPIVNGFDLSDFGDFCTAIRKYNLQIGLSHTKYQQLSEVVELPITGDPNAMMRTKIILPIVHEGRIDALATWYTFDLGAGEVLSMGPGGDSLWRQNIQMVHLSQPLKPGDQVEMEVVVTKWAKDHAQQWLMFDKIGLVGADADKHDTALSSFDALGGQVWHFDMMSDLKRNDAYERALNAVVTPDSIVLDIGTGSGLLAMMAARAGAKHVYACEMNADVAEKARTVIKTNGLADKITVIGLRSSLLQIGEHLPRKADVVVTETMGTDLLSESMAITLSDARERLVTPSAVLIPGRGRVLGQLIEIEHPWHFDGYAAPQEGEVDLRPLNQLLPKFWTMVQLKKIQYRPLSDIIVLHSVDFAQPLNPKGVLSVLDVPIIAAGRLHAVALWWDAHLGTDAEGDITLETGPESRYASTDHAHWSQMLQVLTPDGVPVAPGEAVPLVMYTDNTLTHVELPRRYREAKAIGA